MENNNENKPQKPIHLLILKIIGFILLGIGIIGIIMFVSNSFGSITSLSGSNFEETRRNMSSSFNKSATGMFMFFIGISGGVTCLRLGFRPSITKLKTKTTRYIQEENKEDFTKIASNTAEIASDAITTTVKAIKEGLKEDNSNQDNETSNKSVKFCPECGTKLSKDSKFCVNCGKEQ